jgi:hypothetical protein
MNLGISRLVTLAVAILAGSTVFAHPSTKEPTLAERFGGTWVGTFEGSNSGKVEIAIVVGDNGSHTARLSIKDSDMATYDVTAKSVVLEGEKGVIKYDTPGSDFGEVTVEGTFVGDAASGTWSYSDRTGRSTSGTWKTARAKTA